MKKNVNKPGAIHTDNQPVNQPQNSSRFVLNGVNETDDGDSGSITVEESNEQCHQLTDGYVPLKEVYIGSGDTVIFSVAKDESSSEIGILDQECNYNVLVNADFGFSLTKGVDATYRLRRGCERTIYWTDPVPRVVNIDELNDYKDDLGNWKVSAFSLFKRYSKIPVFDNIEERENGSVTPGSYIFSIQYLDDDFNPTEFITSSGRVNVYNDSTSKDFERIRGSVNSDVEYHDFGDTNKSIKLSLANLDTDYPFYRIAIIAANTGSGRVTSVEYSQEIPTEVLTYTYTGQGTVQGTLEEVQSAPLNIDSAEHIEQIDNKLLLSNTKGKQINYCKLQTYASRIKSDFVTKEVLVNEISESNSKSPTIGVDGAGYMPGEIESFGIVYVFDDGTTSPTYHIPGKSPTYKSQMSDDNKCEDIYYTDNNDCDDYWGVDSEGVTLKNQAVRHHRFPLRSEINKPLIRKETFKREQITNILFLNVSGTHNGTEEVVNLTINYSIDGQEGTQTDSVNLRTYDPVKGMKIRVASSLKEITFVSVETEVDTNLSFTTETKQVVNEIDASAYKTDIFGIKFSNIAIPSTEDTNGHKVIGYYIVKNERDEANKTILDSAVLTPTMEEPYYVASGHISPDLQDTSVIKQDTFTFVNPEHKFNNREYKNASTIIQEGVYDITEKTISAVRTQDVMAGTSYDPEAAKKREKDNDGFDLHTVTKDNKTVFLGTGEVFLNKADIEEIGYLDCLSSKAYTDTDDERKELFNVSSDNKVGYIIATVKKEIQPGKLPYVVFKRELANPYSNFRYLPYYKQSKNIVLFSEETLSSTTVFGGDSYVSPMRYTNTFYYDTRVRERDTKSGIFNIVIGALAVIAGALIAVGTLGGGVALAAMVAGFGISQISTGLKKEKIARVYSELYEAGLKNCVEDDVTKQFFDVNPPDDEVQWVGETITNLWFESSVNLSLRYGLTNGLPDFLDAPATLAKKPESDGVADEPQNEIDTYVLEKLTTLDSENSNGRLYQGFANAEIYESNPDYTIIDNAKIFNHLGIEYDCCSDCTEVFKHRTHFSETSFQEELTDNYRIFLPNNYRDIQGETGEITDLFKIQNNLYIHTTESLYHLPQNFQERVTGDILSFLGTGEFFNIPPRKMVDSDNSSAGTRHKKGAIKTKYGVLFPSVDEAKWYLFNGNNLEPITDVGVSKYFLRNMPFTAEQQYYAVNQEHFPLSNAPSSKYGVGYLSTYDSDKERLIVTKKDYSFKQSVLDNSDFNVIENGGNMIFFNDYQQTIQGYRETGYVYEGIVDNKMKFSKTFFDDVQEERTYLQTIPSDADIHLMLDLSGSFGSYDGEEITQIRAAIDSWLTNFRQANPEWTGNVYEYQDKSERWLRYPERIGTETYAGQNLGEKDIIVISFCNESSPYGNDGGLQETIPAPTSEYMDDYEDFKVLHSQYKSFIGIHYPIVFDEGRWAGPSTALLQQSLAAIKGTPYTTSEVDSVGYNPALTQTEYAILKNSLTTSNPYPDDGLENYGWIGKFTRNNIGSIIDPNEFANDINTLLEGAQKETTETVTVRKPRTVVDYVEGEVKNDVIETNKSWTMSYSLKTKKWVSWHSYLPNFYFSVAGKFYSWIYDNNYMWRHNKKGNYRTFYGQAHPHVLEYVSLSNPVQTRVWEDIAIQTEAHKYFPEYNEYNEVKDVTFNKLLVYNSRQISGVLNIKQKNADKANYFSNITTHKIGEVLVDNNEGDWYMNGFRDMRVNSQVPMFKSDGVSLKDEYFIDKVVNEEVIDPLKPWTQMESFRDKYLVIRLIFDTFDDIKLITNYSLENETPSNR